MIYKSFGKTGKLVSALGMGISRFLPKDYDTPEGMERCAQVIVKAAEHGINYFDVGPNYCGWRAEEMLGMALKEIPGEIYVSAKSSSTQDPTASAMRKRLETSLSKLGVEKITFYNMWGLLDYAQYQDVIRPNGPLAGAIQAKEEGLIEHICFSAHCTGEEIEKILEDGHFDGMTFGYNAINFKYREKGLQEAKKRGLGVAIMNPLYGGVMVHNADRFDFIRNDVSQSVAQAALLFVASHDAVSTVLSGMTRVEEIEENASVFDTSYIFPENKIAAIKERIISEFDSLCTGCQYCSGCPQEIEIYKLMLAYNQFLLADRSVDSLRGYMRDVWRYTDEMRFPCVACGRCEKKCTQHIKIIDRIAQINGFAQEYLTGVADRLRALFEHDTGTTLGIYAAGPFAERIVKMYRELIGEIDFPVVFYDSNPDKWGKSLILDDCPIQQLTRKHILENKVSKVIIASEAYADEIYEQIRFVENDGVEVVRVSI